MIMRMIYIVPFSLALTAFWCAKFWYSTFESAFIAVGIFNLIFFAESYRVLCLYWRKQPPAKDGVWSDAISISDSCSCLFGVLSVLAFGVGLICVKLCLENSECVTYIVSGVCLVLECVLFSRNLNCAKSELKLKFECWKPGQVISLRYKAVGRASCSGFRHVRVSVCAKVRFDMSCQYYLDYWGNKNNDIDVCSKLVACEQYDGCLNCDIKWPEDLKVADKYNVWMVYITLFRSSGPALTEQFRLKRFKDEKL